jgi:hypothetical protein
MGQLPLSTWVQTLLVQWLRSHIQRSDQYHEASEQTVAATLDAGDLSVVSGMLIPSHRQGSWRPYPYKLSLVLVAV